jgi:hypothetical protein
VWEFFWEEQQTKNEDARYENERREEEKLVQKKKVRYIDMDVVE